MVMIPEMHRVVSRAHSSGLYWSPSGLGRTGSRALIRVINKRRSAYIVFALVAEDIDFAKLGLSYGTQLRILLDKATTEAAGIIFGLDDA